MIIPKNIEDITKLVANGSDIFEALEELRIAPIEFFSHLDKNQEDKNLFESARQIAVERMVSSFGVRIDEAKDKFELDKAIAYTKASQWMAEKIIPKTYGQRMEVNTNTTIDIRGVLALANARVAEALEVKPNIKQIVVDAPKAEDLLE